MICIKMSQIIDATPRLRAEAPSFDHGDTEANPRPVPNETRLSDTAAATKAPAATACQDTPDDGDSVAFIFADSSIVLSSFFKSLPE
jgi:hypothetical protein